MQKGSRALACRFLENLKSCLRDTISQLCAGLPSHSPAESILSCTQDQHGLWLRLIWTCSEHAMSYQRRTPTSDSSSPGAHKIYLTLSCGSIYLTLSCHLPQIRHFSPSLPQLCPLSSDGNVREYGREPGCQQSGNWEG